MSLKKYHKNFTSALNVKAEVSWLVCPKTNDAPCTTTHNLSLNGYNLEIYQKSSTFYINITLEISNQLRFRYLSRKMFKEYAQ